ncbi:hypothetical protein KP696_19425 [Nocardia seriolae]|uniref:Uncharacterized protein n=2 Tax=Nocardia seriolae TaxID=37332 RepID=A0A0B8NPR3_9NOCA|nr:DUF5997 family protein [Nocardia seriolae]APB01641.1 hypothetical protein NS506_07621 [Nocardia seriolae]MTJ60886.1 hypothetical protein [Nocardia seriolae]MTJ75694.1 hypothetical protein [Nocardia seriolae]MTJ90976.1 hypothetical protein [Nocardia seriolae]MTK34933.1 hypothetical protein [Nocardia seriolae]
MSPDKNPQTMKPLTAADKLGIYLPATPEEFRNSPVTRAQLEELRANPPQWLTDLRANGPFPRDVVARKLGISNSGLARNDISDALTTVEIDTLLADPPEWLLRERDNLVEVRKEAERVKEKEAARRAASNRPAKNRFGK